MLSVLKKIFVLGFLLSGQWVYAQRETNIWYFGRYLGLDFNSGTATPLNDGQLNTTEGVATICNPNGNLLFYTEGTRIWNRLHQVMPNGSGLFGNFSSTQSAIIVPKIGDATRYYVFTVDAVGGARGLNYSVVNMALDGGKGDVELKNQPLQLNVVEKVTAVRHCNNQDVWVVTHGSMNDIYYSFLVGAAGISTTPVISHSGITLTGPIPPAIDSTWLGYLKASPDGKRIAAAHWTMNTDLSNFDNSTGIVSNSISLFQPGDPHYLVYGVEFSPDSKLLYSTVFYTDPVNAQKKNALFQYNASLATPSAIISSKQQIAQSSDPIQVFAALQIAPDGKMYMAKNIYNHIAAINNPNVYGPGCNYISNAIQYSLPTQQSSFGLPTFIQSYFYPPDSFRYTGGCNLDVAFNYSPQPNVSSVQWNFDDPLSGANNSSTQTNPTHLFTTAGTYNVQLIKFTSCGPDTLRRQVTSNGLNVTLGNDTLVCGGTSLLLDPLSTGSSLSYLWQDGSTNPTLSANNSGLYWVEVSNSSGCTRRDSINLVFKSIPVFNLGPDRDLCQGENFTLNATTSGATNYLWNTGGSNPTITINQAGLYWCETDNAGCKFRDSLSITRVKPLPVVNLGPDQTVCEGTIINLDASYPNASYVWQNGSVNPVFAAVQPGIYSVTVNLAGCIQKDTVVISHNLKPRFDLGPDQLICAGGTILLQPRLDPSWQLIWQDASSNPTFTITRAGNYSLSATNNCGTAIDQVVVKDGLCKLLMPTGFTPNNDGRNDIFRALGTELISEFDMKIFDRGGQLVFQTSDKSKGWDGRVNGQQLPSAIFVYLVQYKESQSAEARFQKGTLALIR